MLTQFCFFNIIKGYALTICNVNSAYVFNLSLI